MSMVAKIHTDFLVIGTGIAGLSFALKAAKHFPDKKVMVICKSKPKETNTRYAQGGIAAVLKNTFDSPEKHIKDTVKAGGSRCDQRVVEFVVKEAPARLKELIDHGVKFDKGRGDAYDLVKEGGHSDKRVYHRGDFTGLEIERKLLAATRKLKNVTIMPDATAVDLITNEHLPYTLRRTHNTCYGVFVLLNGKSKIVPVISKVTLLATGGIGQIFEHTTNSSIATGDGIAMAHRAGARISNLEFIQFHPTALYDKYATRDFLISEAVRGMGAELLNANGEAFMKYYDENKDLATRDVVSRAIKTEIDKKGHGYVFLDCTRIPKKKFEKHFPVISAKCFSIGIDPQRDLIPVVPSAHYCCGGIDTDHHGRSSIKNLYVCGESANTGLHGANRLASNSLLEALVFAHRIFRNASKKIDSITLSREISVPDSFLVGVTTYQNSGVTTTMIKKIMAASVGIITSDERIENGINQILKISKQGTVPAKICAESVEINNLLTVSLLVLQASLRNKNNEGVFYKSDDDMADVRFMATSLQDDFNR